MQQHLFRRYALFIVGLWIAALGVGFSTRAGLGTSPVSSFPYSVSLVSHMFSFGGWLNLLSIIQITVQVLLLRSRCHVIDIAIQTVLAFLYGSMTNWACALTVSLPVTGYPMQLFWMGCSCFLTAFGIWLQLMGNVAMLPGEAMNRAIAEVTGVRYENIKVLFDCLYIAAAAVVCLVFLGRLQGVREGSIIAALVIGNIIRLFNRLWQRLTAAARKGA